MQGDIIQSITYIGIIYLICISILIPSMIYLLKNRKNQMDMRYAWPLAFAIMITVLVVVFSGALAFQL